VPVRAHHGDTDLNIPVVRAQHLIHYVGVLRDAGVPVERELERSRLPVFIEQTPNAYVSLPRALDWVWRSSRELGIMELGFLAGRAGSLGTLHPDLQRAVIGAPTGLSRIEVLSNHVHRENSAVEIDIRREGIDLRVVCEVLGFQNSPFVGFAEWKVIGGIIDIVRSAAGPDWCPAEITFVSRGRPSDATLEAYGNARILTGQRYCSVLVAAADMAQTCIDRWRESFAVDASFVVGLAAYRQSGIKGHTVQSAMEASLLSARAYAVDTVAYWSLSQIRHSPEVTAVIVGIRKG
jgi:hypothetical protein